MINDKLGIDTVYIRSGELGVISSSMVFELFENGENISNYVPKALLEVMKRYKGYEKSILI